VTNNVDDGLLILLRVTCDQQHSAVGHFVIQSSNGLGVGPVRHAVEKEVGEL